MDVNGAVVLVTGANRGIGAEFVEQLKRRGAAKIYAAARDADTIDAEGVHPLALDVTDAGPDRSGGSGGGRCPGAHQQRRHLHRYVPGDR